MSVLKLFPSHIKWSRPDGTLTNEAIRILEILMERAGGMLGDMGVDVFALGYAQGDYQLPDTYQVAAADSTYSDIVQPVQAGPVEADVMQLVMPTQFTHIDYTGTLKGSKGEINIGAGQITKDADGKVGIGGVTATDDKLNVNGNINALIYKADNTAGLTRTVTGFGGLSLTFKGGIVTASANGSGSGVTATINKATFTSITVENGLITSFV